MSSSVPNLKHTPLHAQHLEAKGRMVPFAGFEMPVQYKGVAEEHRAVREQVGLFDVSHMGEVELRGPNALETADKLFTNNIGRLTNGQACYTCMCLASGGIVDDLVVYRIADDHLLICVNASNRAKDFAHMVSVADGNCEVIDSSDSWAQLAVQGPNATAVVNALHPSLKDKLEGLKPFRFFQTDIWGPNSIVSRTGYTGENGYELYVPADRAAELWNALLAAGEPHGLQPAGLGARDSLRLEMGYPLYGNDIDEATNPYEADLGWVVKLKKPTQFVGREFLEREQTYGPAQRMVGLEITGRGIARPGYKVCHPNGSTVIGRVTSGTKSPTLGKAIAMAYVQTPYTAEGTELAVEIRGQPVAAIVTSRPFLKRK